MALEEPVILDKTLAHNARAWLYHVLTAPPVLRHRLGHTESPSKVMPGTARILGCALPGCIRKVPIFSYAVNGQEIPCASLSTFGSALRLRPSRTKSAELHAVAAARGWTVVESYRDEAISGAKGRDKRPGFDRMWKDAARREFDLVAARSVDRFGRSLADLASSWST